MRGKWLDNDDDAHDLLPSDSEHIRRVRQDTNKMAVDGPRPAESLRHLACSLAALNPAPWEKVR